MASDPRREFFMRAVTVTGAVISLVAVAVVSARHPDTRRVRARHGVRSPSGRFLAKIEIDAAADGVRCWRPVVLDNSGAVVFRSDALLPERPAPKITWESDLDTLWVVSPGTGLAFVQEGLQGWTSTTLAESDAYLAPAEARA